VPEGMGLIVRTAGANRPKPEIKRDCEYLLRLWDDIRERTLASVAPALIYEEANLIKRTIRDVYTREIDQVLVEGDEGYRAARDFMAMLMPQHVKKVQEWTNGQPLFAKHQVEAQLDQMFQPVVQLKSGGYLVINQTEALVAIDVNSGRSTRERNIEDTAVRTNLEAAEEVARQLRLRDLAGLIVIDFIDMESRRNNGLVERKLKEALKNDRARIQVGSISPFGLMEMSRQRLRPSLAEAMLIPCPHCAGAGHVRSTATLALAVLRSIEDEAAKRRAAELAVHLAPDVAIYMFNHKRDRLSMIESRFGVSITFVHDERIAASFRIETVRVQSAETKAEYAPLAMGAPDRDAPRGAAPEMGGEAAEIEVETAAPELASVSASETALEQGSAAETNGAEKGDEGERRGRRRRRRRRPRREGNGIDAQAQGEQDQGEQDQGDSDQDGPDQDGAEPQGEAEAALMPEAESAPDSASPAVAVPEAPAAQGEPDLISAITAELEAALESGAAPAEPEKPRRRSRARPRAKKAEAPETPPAPAAPVFVDIADIFEAAENAERAAPLPAPAMPAPVAPVTPPVLEAGAETGLETDTAPAVQPVVVGQNGQPAEKKRGWWRR
jgi:ribonuclease E